MDSSLDPELVAKWASEEGYHLVGNAGRKHPFPIYQDLRDFSSTAGSLPSLQQFMEITLPSLPPSLQAKYCDHVVLSRSGTQCSDLPCNKLVKEDIIIAVEGNQVETFNYLFDSFISPRNESIPRECLDVAAKNGCIELAKAFEEREDKWFDRLGQRLGLGWNLIDWPSQISIAVYYGKLDYARFLIDDLGADVNVGFPEQSPLTSVLRSMDNSG